MLEALPWPAVGSIISGLIAVAFIAYIWPYRNEPGAALFMAMLGAVTLWAVSYGVALFVFDPTLRALFEIPIWLGICLTNVFFLAFALEYTGRKDEVRSKSMAGLGLIVVGFVGLIGTNPRHELVWSDYRIDPVFGVATVSQTNEAWLFIIMLVLVIITAAAVLVLVDTFLSYGPLYRYQTLALALSPLPIIPGILLWLFQVGPAPQLNLAPLLFPLHLGLDMYAFFRRNMFELTPAARRAGDQTAIDDLGIGVLIVDDEQRIINLNQQAATIFETNKRSLLGQWLTDLGADIDLERTDQRIRRSNGRHQREYAITVSTINDSAGNGVGQTITLQDITLERQREQRLSVLNRVLRHNLRNDLNVASGYLELVREETDNDQHRRMLATATRNTDSVLALGEKAREVERTLDTETLGTEPVELNALLEQLTETLTETHGGTVAIEQAEELTIRTNRQLLGSVLSNVIENGLEHGGEQPQVTVRTAVDRVVDMESRTPVGRNVVRIEVHDTGPGIPSHELSVLKQGEETDLEHGSGIGLWLVEWGTTALGGTAEFEATDSGTVVTIELPDVAEEERAAEPKTPSQSPATNEQQATTAERSTERLADQKQPSE